jgi:hypothetical protein
MIIFVHNHVRNHYLQKEKDNRKQLKYQIE